MKVIFFLALLPVMTACNEVEFKVGDCMQKPDESVVWEIKELGAGVATVQMSGNNAPEMVKEVQLSDSWIKTRCR